ncbi:protein regulator of cytokinesis 1 isoform X2 [Nilaparvata lugens]|uniref:protein regulator of cytokinesis 1 isoform X2 n=1 Tax=Nilaparvata lugens TaxID=108931 RepID=UPI00193DC3B2|nr:protein regulator of cytokinesis 1 isoform X2 [Nilaparvata lugens]
MASQAEIWIDMEEEVIKTAKAVYEKLQTNWEELYGNQSEEVLKRSRSFIENMKEYLFNLERESDNEKTAMISNIEELLAKIQKLQKELHIKESIDMEFEPLAEVNNKLYNMFSSHMRLKRERQAEYKKLRDEEEELCKLLRLQLAPEVKGVASQAEMNNLEELIEELKEQKAEMENSIDDLRNKCTELMNELGVSPLLSIEKFCISGNTTLFSYDRDTEKELKKLLEKMLNQQQSAIEEANQLRSKLSVLWDRVTVPHHIRDEVLSNCRGHSKHEIAQLRNEVNRCEELKRANLKIYVSKVKEELQSWWDKCCFSDVQRASFRHFHETRLTEDLLEILEMELEKVRGFYMKYEHIYQMNEERRIMFEKFRELEESAKDSNRLFNRGCLLLKEEKARKKLQREMPALETKLKAKLDEFEATEGEPFLIFGKDLRLEMEEEWQEVHQNRDAKKTARKVAKTVGVAQPAANMGTPLMMRKRKLPPSSSSSRTNVRPGRQNVKAMTPSNVSTSSTYSLFQEHFEDLTKEASTPCRSTIVVTPVQSSGYGQTRVLRARNGQGPLHSSPKTPLAKPDHRLKANSQNIPKITVYNSSAAKRGAQTSANTTRRLATPVRNAAPAFRNAVGSASRIPKVVLPTKSPRLPIIF